MTPSPSLAPCVLCGAPLRPETLALLNPLLVFAIALGVLFGGALITQLLWNAVVPWTLRGWPEMSYGQALVTHLFIAWARFLFRRRP